MIVALSHAATEEQIRTIEKRIAKENLKVVRMPGDDRVVIGIISSIPADTRYDLADSLDRMEGVDHITHVSRPYKLASREFHAHDTVVQVGDCAFGGKAVVVIAGPCSIESEEQMLECANGSKAAGATMLRGGAFKPRSSPYAFQGLAKQGLEIMRDVGKQVGLKTVSEVMSPQDVGLVADHVDMLQIGARSMQNFPLLVEAGNSGHPILLKRGPSATVDEFLLAAEYLLSRSDNDVVLCERGVHPLDRTYTRNTLDLSIVPVLKEISHLPVVVDPSHGTGHAKYVPSMALAAVACGADGLIVEMHPNPSQAMSDAAQALLPDALCKMVEDCRKVAEAVGRSI